METWYKYNSNIVYKNDFQILIILADMAFLMSKHHNFEHRSDSKIDGEPDFHIIYLHNQWYHCPAGKRWLSVDWRVYLDSNATD